MRCKSDKTELVPTNSAFDDGAGDKAKDKVKSAATERVPTNGDVNDGAGDKVKDKVTDEVTADTGRSGGVGDRDEFNHRLIFDGRQLRRKMGLSDEIGRAHV